MCLRSHELPTLDPDGRTTLRALGHRFKTPARTLGAARLGDLFEALERAVGAGELERAAGVVAEVRLEAIRVGAALQTHRRFPQPG